MNNYYQQQQYAMAAPSAEIRQQVLKNTYLLLALSMIPTAIGALIGVNMSFAFLLGSPIMGTLLLIGGMYFLMFMVQKNRNSFTGIVDGIYAFDGLALRSVISSGIAHSEW